MTFKSMSFKARPAVRPTAAATRALQRRHKDAMDDVVSDAKALAQDRRRALDSITDPNLKLSAAR